MNIDTSRSSDLYPDRLKSSLLMTSKSLRTNLKPSNLNNFNILEKRNLLSKNGLSAGEALRTVSVNLESKRLKSSLNLNGEVKSNLKLISKIEKPKLTSEILSNKLSSLSATNLNSTVNIQIGNLTNRVLNDHEISVRNPVLSYFSFR